MLLLAAVLAAGLAANEMWLLFLLLLQLVAAVRAVGVASVLAGWGSLLVSLGALSEPGVSFGVKQRATP